MTATGTPAATGGRAGGRRRSLGVVALLVVVLVAVAAVAGAGSSSDSTPLGPDSVADSGARGLRLFLEGRGAQVQVTGVPGAGRHGIGLLLQDDLDAEQQSALRAWVRGGNTVVIADPHQGVVRTPSASRPVEDPRLARQDCDLPGLEGVEALDVSPLPIGAANADPGSLDSTAFETPSLLRVPRGGGATACFGSGSDAFVVSAPLGDGTVVNLGSPDPFLNARLADADNAALAADLLVPTPGQDVLFIDSQLAGAGSTNVLDLIPTRVKQALVELLVAFVVFAVWSAVRLGRPVAEAQPVAIPGSALVGAVGGLRRRNGGADQAAQSLRDATTRALARRYGMSRQSPPETVAAVVAQRTGADQARLHAVLTYRPVSNEAQLVALATELDQIRQEVLDGPGRAASR